MNAPISSLAARESAGGGSPGAYLPVSTPWASGDHTTWEIPLRSQMSSSSASGACQSIEYCGWEETNLIVFGTASPASIWSTVHSLKPR